MCDILVNFLRSGERLPLCLALLSLLLRLASPYSVATQQYSNVFGIAFAAPSFSSAKLRTIPHSHNPRGRVYCIP